MLYGLIFALLWVMKWLNPAYYSAFNYETAQHYLELVSLSSNHLLLSGPLTSHAWLRLSSFPYYFFYPLFALLRFHPLSLPLTWVFVSALTVLLNWVVVKQWFSKSAAWISSVLMLCTANWLYFDEHIGFFNFVIPMMYGWLWSIRARRWWLAWFLLSCMGCLHASAWMLVPVLIWQQKSFSWKSLVGLLIPQLPLVMVMVTTRSFGPLRFFAWVPYRLWSYITSKPLGLDRQVVTDTTLVDVMTFFKQVLFPASWPWWVGLIVLSWIGWGLWEFRRHRTIKQLSVWWMTLFVGVAALWIHRNPPFHYVVPLVMLPTVIMAVLINMMPLWWRRGVVALLLCINLPVWWSHTRLTTTQPIRAYVSIVKVATAIISNAHGKPFGLTRKGTFDYYPGQAREQYDYMLTYLGRPISPSSSLQYILVDQTVPPLDPRSSTLIDIVDDISIYKWSF
jgi:hypothetical protein